MQKHWFILPKLAVVLVSCSNTQMSGNGAHPGAKPSDSSAPPSADESPGDTDPNSPKKAKDDASISTDNSQTTTGDDVDTGTAGAQIILDSVTIQAPIFPLFVSSFYAKQAPAAPDQWTALPTLDKLPTLVATDDAKVRVDALLNANWDGCVSGTLFYKVYLKIEASHDGGSTFPDVAQDRIAFATNGGNSGNFGHTFSVASGESFVVRLSASFNDPSYSVPANCVSIIGYSGIFHVDILNPGRKVPFQIPNSLRFGGPKGLVSVSTKISQNFGTPSVLAAYAFEGSNPATPWMDIGMASPIPKIDFTNQARVLVMYTGAVNNGLCQVFLNSPMPILEYDTGIKVSIDGGTTSSVSELEFQNTGSYSANIASPFLLNAKAGDHDVFFPLFRYWTPASIPSGCISDVSVSGDLTVNIYPEVL